ncbi:hypothetical protein Taro_024457 [Colocasia esculenta]|uniref:Uncharacterized protein n=1 Tax=Colocasia esculenta TaxID=4460 RepID=A0A843V6D5_COLES|nr:hypothetical protein [Colocasia esculenta]
MQGTWSCRLERGGGSHSYEKAPTVSERSAPEPPSAEDATIMEVAILSRRLGRSRQDRDALGCRDLVATATADVGTIAWDPRPREPVERVLRATSVLELAAQQADSGAEGKTVVMTVALSRLQSSRGWSGTPRTVRSTTRRRPASPVSHCLAPCGPRSAWRGETSQQRQGARRAEETGR